MLGKVEHNFIEKSIVIGTMHYPWQRTLTTGSPQIYKLIDFCLHPHMQARMRDPLLTMCPTDTDLQHLPPVYEIKNKIGKGNKRNRFREAYEK